MKKSVFTISLMIISVFLSAQSVDINNILISQKVNIRMGQSKHLYADFILQKKFPVKAMIESGIPFLVLDSTFVFNHMKELGISLVESNNVLNLAGNRFVCRYITNDTIYLNNLYYKGKVLITDLTSKGVEVMYPIHTFRNPDDANSQIIELDISSKYITPLTREELKMKKSKYKKFPMRNDGYGEMYAIDSKLEVLSSVSKRYYSLQGDFLLDLGNASFLFLLDQHPKYQEFISNSDFKLQQGRNNQGKLIPVKAFWTSKCYIADKSFSNVTIAITQMLPKFTTVGILGLKFFENFNVIFDFEEKTLYLRKK